MALSSDSASLIVAVDIENPLTFGGMCAPRLEAIIPSALQVVMDEIASSIPSIGAANPRA